MPKFYWYFRSSSFSHKQTCINNVSCCFYVCNRVQRLIEEQVFWLEGVSSRIQSVLTPFHLGELPEQRNHQINITYQETISGRPHQYSQEDLVLLIDKFSGSFLVFQTPNATGLRLAVCGEGLGLAVWGECLG